MPAAAMVLAFFCGQSAFGQTPAPTSPTSPPPPSGGTGPTGGGTTNNPPILLSLYAQQVPGQKYRISGRVADETPQNCGVVISGAANGIASCNAQGYFDAVFAVATPGQIQAIVGDGQTQSGSSVLLLSNVAPTVGNFTAVQGAGNNWTFSGTVGDEAPAGLSVTLSGPTGVNGATATVLVNGSWSVTLTLAEGTAGNVSATATDWYGLTGVGYTTFGS